MKVIAKHWVNYNGVWHRGGEEFEVEDFDEVKEYADAKSDDYVSAVFPPETVAEEPKKKRKKT